jgi:hypothetical protein
MLVLAVGSLVVMTGSAAGQKVTYTPSPPPSLSPFKFGKGNTSDPQVQAGKTQLVNQLQGVMGWLTSELNKMQQAVDGSFGADSQSDAMFAAKNQIVNPQLSAMATIKRYFDQIKTATNAADIALAAAQIQLAYGTATRNVQQAPSLLTKLQQSASAAPRTAPPPPAKAPPSPPPVAVAPAPKVATPAPAPPAPRPSPPPPRVRIMQSLPADWQKQGQTTLAALKDGLKAFSDKVAQTKGPVQNELRRMQDSVASLIASAETALRGVGTALAKGDKLGAMLAWTDFYYLVQDAKKAQADASAKLNSLAPGTTVTVEVPGSVARYEIPGAPPGAGWGGPIARPPPASPYR